MAASYPKQNKAPSNRRRGWASRRWHAVRDWIASERLRRVRIYLFQGYVLVALLLFAALALLANTTPIFQPDVQITRALQDDTPAWFGVFMVAVSWPGYTPQIGSIILAVVIGLAIAGLRWEAITALFTAVSAGVLNLLIKGVVHRPRPAADLVHVVKNLTDFSFPSGHVMFYTAFFGFLLFLSFTLLKRSWQRYLFNAVMIVLIVLIGLSRMLLGEHWASDVLGGYLLGSLALILSILFYRWGKERYFVPQPVASEPSKQPVKPEEKKEIKEALKNPLLTQKEQAKEEEAKDSVHDGQNTPRA